MTDRERFEAWCRENAHPVGIRSDGSYVGSTECRWGAWQAATAAAEQDKWAAVRRCVEIVRQWEYSATYISDAIKAEFPEAWK